MDIGGGRTEGAPTDPKPPTRPGQGQQQVPLFDDALSAPGVSVGLPRVELTNESTGLGQSKRVLGNSRQAFLDVS
jgi:hypothetical protein